MAESTQLGQNHACYNLSFSGSPPFKAVVLPFYVLDLFSLENCEIKPKYSVRNKIANKIDFSKRYDNILI